MTSIGQKILRILQPQAEKARMDFRMAIAQSMANADDITRTVKGLNGHLCEHPAIKNALKLKK